MKSLKKDTKNELNDLILEKIDGLGKSKKDT